MANDNRVIIYVVSENKTKAGFDEAKKDAEKAGDDAGQGFMSKFASWLVGGQSSFGGGGIGGILSTAFSAGLPGIGALAIAAGALITELDGILSGFAAAAAGAGAFYILGHNTISNLIQDYSMLQSAQVAVQKAQDKYNLDPTKQNLKALQTAQLNQAAAQQVAQQDLGAAAPAVDKFATSLGNLQQQFQPVLFQTMTDAFTVLQHLLPLLLPLANAFANALQSVLKQVDAFVQSKAFHDWFKQFLALVGPSTIAIAQGFGQIIIAFGKLLTVMSNKDVVNAIKYAFDVIAGTLNALRLIIIGAMKAWDWFWSNLKEAAKSAAASFRRFGKEIEDVVVGIIRWMEHAGSAIVNGLANGIDSATGGLLSKVGGLANKIIGFFGGHLRIGSPSKVFEEFGHNIVAGLVQGIDQSAGRATAAVGRLAGPAAIGGGGGGGGGQIVMNWGSPQTQALVKAIWPSLQFEIRARGGGGPKSAQIALGQVH